MKIKKFLYTNQAKPRRKAKSAGRCDVRRELHGAGLQTSQFNAQTVTPAIRVPRPSRERQADNYAESKLRAFVSREFLILLGVGVLTLGAPVSMGYAQAKLQTAEGIVQIENLNRQLQVLKL